MDKTLHTKYGTAKIYNGYYIITSSKKGNHNKRLHRLIARDYFGDWIDEPDPNGDRWDIHHIDGDKTNNCVLNLEPIPERDHKSLHNKGKTFSEESKKKMSEAKKGKYVGKNNPNYGKTYIMPDDTKIKMSKAHNKTGFFRVYKKNSKRYKQGFIWVYEYNENYKSKTIQSVDLKKLEEKVKKKKLKWMKL